MNKADLIVSVACGIAFTLGYPVQAIVAAVIYAVLTYRRE